MPHAKPPTQDMFGFASSMAKSKKTKQRKNPMSLNQIHSQVPQKYGGNQIN
jgi:hypothetical protein